MQFCHPTWHTFFGTLCALLPWATGRRCRGSTYLSFSNLWGGSHSRGRRHQMQTLEEKTCVLLCFGRLHHLGVGLECQPRTRLRSVLCSFKMSILANVSDRSASKSLILSATHSSERLRTTFHCWGVRASVKLETWFQNIFDHKFTSAAETSFTPRFRLSTFHICYVE